MSASLPTKGGNILFDFAGDRSLIELYDGAGDRATWRVVDPFLMIHVPFIPRANFCNTSGFHVD